MLLKSVTYSEESRNRPQTIPRRRLDHPSDGRRGVWGEGWGRSRGEKGGEMRRTVTVSTQMAGAGASGGQASLRYLQIPSRRCRS